MSRSRGTQRMSPGSPQDGHSHRDTSNSSSASSIKMPELVTSSSDDNGSFRNNTKNSPNFSSRSHGRHSSISRENLLDDTTSSEEGNDDEDTQTKLVISLVMKEAAAQQLREEQGAAHAAPAQKSCPRRTGTKELLTPHRHEDKWHKGCQLFPPRQEKEKARLPKCHHRCALMHPPCIDGGSWMQCKSQCQDKHDHNGRHNCYGGCHNQPYM